MLEVKKQNIKNNILFVLFLLGGFIAKAQYTPTFLSDSTKQNIIQMYNLTIQPTSSTDLSINRNDMAIFCKWELDIQDLTTIPVKFRLGSQEIVDRLENKGPTSVNID